ncbi:MAG: GDSL-type esterase/lipase family protein [Pseudomonadota bacterium]
MKLRSTVAAVVLSVTTGAAGPLLSGCGPSPIDDEGNPGADASAPAADGSIATGGAPGTGGQSAATGGASATGGATTGSGGGGSVGTGGVGNGGATDAGVAGGADGGALGGRGTAGVSGGAGVAGRGGGGTGAGGAEAGGAGRGGAGTGGVNAGGAAGGGTTKITVWLAGDSTMANGSSPCPIGWGRDFQSHFNANVKVTNSAVGGTTVRSWLYNVTSTLGADGECTLTSAAPQARWTTMADGMKAGDYLLIQFGINDTTSATCPKHVSLATFKELFGMMAQAAKDKGANPIFVTSVSSISCSGATARGTRGTFAAATKEAGTQFGVPVIDLEQLSVAFYTASGFCPSTDTAATFNATTPIGSFFCADHTHFEAAGAAQIAGLVAKAIKDQAIPLASYLLP